MLQACRVREMSHRDKGGTDNSIGFAIDREHEDNSGIQETKTRRGAAGLICGAQSFPRNVSSGRDTSLSSARGAAACARWIDKSGKH